MGRRTSRGHRASGIGLTLALALLPRTASAQCPSPTIPPTIAAYYDPSRTMENVFYIDHDGAIQDLTSTDGSATWSTTELEAEGTFAPGSPMLAYVDSYYKGRVFFLSNPSSSCTSMDINELRGVSPPTVLHDLTATYGAGVVPQGLYLGGGCPAGGTYDCCPAFRDSTGAAVPNSIAFPTNLAGFQDAAPTPTHHVFYFSWNQPAMSCVGFTSVNPGLYELYASDEYDTGWTNHSIASIATVYNNTPVGLSAVWDGYGEHVYWNPTPGILDETYYYTGWSTPAALTSGSEHAPLYNTAVLSPGDEVVWLWGATWNVSSLGSTTQASQYWRSLLGVWSRSQPTTPTFAPRDGTVSFTWQDSTTAGLSGSVPSGTDGGVFWVHAGSVYAYVPGLGYGTLATDATTNVHYAPTSNQIAGFYDGTDLHVFYIGADGYVHELYLLATSITNSTLCATCWTEQSISSSANAAH